MIKKYFGVLNKEDPEVLLSSQSLLETSLQVEVDSWGDSELEPNDVVTIYEVTIKPVKRLKIERKIVEIGLEKKK